MVHTGCLPSRHEEAPLATYDRKTGFDTAAEVELLAGLELGSESTLVDLGAGTGMLAAAVADRCRRVIAVDPSPAMLDAARPRGGFECVDAGFPAYEHTGDAPDFVYSRNALHHPPDAWKAVALARVSALLAPGGTFVLRDIVYSCEPGELDDVLEAWFADVRIEHSTFSWLLEPMLEHAGLVLDDVWLSESRTYARYVCRRS